MPSKAGKRPNFWRAGGGAVNAFLSIKYLDTSKQKLRINQSFVAKRLSQGNFLQLLIFEILLVYYLGLYTFDFVLIRVEDMLRNIIKMVVWYNNNGNL